MATHTEYTKQEWKIAVLEDDLAALQEENEHLKASRGRLRGAFLAAMRCYHADSWERPETIREINDALEAACDALQDGDLADADPAPDAGQEGE